MLMLMHIQASIFLFSFFFTQMIVTVYTSLFCHLTINLGNQYLKRKGFLIFL